jgi:hypothetical protein
MLLGAPPYSCYFSSSNPSPKTIVKLGSVIFWTKMEAKKDHIREMKEGRIRQNS